MDWIYIVFVIILFLLAISDLVVGVSNDAVNFLVSAIGSKSAPFWLIMIVASLGVMVGATFSDGMMEVARKGIFNPEMFNFSDIILIFLAVMITDIILLDIFNTLGFPTSTTVSLVFEILGAAVAISIIIISKSGGVVFDYINSNNALRIIGGILLAVVVAFTFGAIVQYFTRIIFSFNTKKSRKYFGAIWGGVAITAITFFMFIKGFKHSFMHDLPAVVWAFDHTVLIILCSFVFWTILFQILKWLFKINVLKVVVLAGTFALAMAFAGNDLVNFIGVPLAGFSSFELWQASGEAAKEFNMAGLAGKVKVPPLFLLISGLIMVIALWTSKKARSVTETSLNLSRQDEGAERFGSTTVSRSIVRAFINVSNGLSSILPKKFVQAVGSRFVIPKNNEAEIKGQSFDLIRASVNLVVASILISIGTSLKLPLSTTYVTFMVAMGTSLSDRAWGRESAVYRITGVITVISGWFITAFVAFSVAGIVAVIIYFGSLPAIIVLLLIAGFIFYKTKVVHKKRKAKQVKDEEKELHVDEINAENIFGKCTNAISDEIKKLPDILNSSLYGFQEENRKELKKAKRLSQDLKDNSKQLKKDIYKIITGLESDFILSAQFYVQEVDHLREIANAANFLAVRTYEHINNNHEGFLKEQITELNDIKNKVVDYIGDIITIIEDNKLEIINDKREEKYELLKQIEELKKIQLKRIKNKEVRTRNSVLYLNILAEYKNLTLFIIRIAKAHRKFMKSKNKKKLMNK